MGGLRGFRRLRKFRGFSVECGSRVVTQSCTEAAQSYTELYFIVPTLLINTIQNYLPKNSKNLSVALCDSSETSVVK